MPEPSPQRNSTFFDRNGRLRPGFSAIAAVFIGLLILSYALRLTGAV
jgi:hypothetical protein